jgi:hypothetical protein
VQFERPRVQYELGRWECIKKDAAYPGGENCEIIISLIEYEDIIELSKKERNNRRTILGTIRQTTTGKKATRPASTVVTMTRRGIMSAPVLHQP